jgi:hypothetical protein
MVVLVVRVPDGEIVSQLAVALAVVALAVKEVGVFALTARVCRSGGLPFTAPLNVNDEGLTVRPVDDVLPVTVITTGTVRGVLANVPPDMVMVAEYTPLARPEGLI